VAGKQFRRESRRARQDELRDVLDKAGLALQQAATTLDSVVQRTSDTSIDLEPLRPAMTTEVTEARKQAELEHVRLAVRLGYTADETEHYTLALRELANARAVLDPTRGHRGDTVRAETPDRRGALRQQQALFYKASSDRIGPDA
jgi:hypothetical protein